VMGHRRAPCVQDEGRAEPCAKMPGVSSDRHQGRRHGLEQGVIDDTLVLERNPCQRCGQGRRSRLRASSQSYEAAD
jgi:hypothetical protein